MQAVLNMACQLPHPVASVCRW